MSKLMRQMQGRTWESLTHLFIPVHLEAELHWIAVIVDLCSRVVYCYDPLEASLQA